MAKVCYKINLDIGVPVDLELKERGPFLQL